MEVEDNRDSLTFMMAVWRVYISLGTVGFTPKLMMACCTRMSGCSVVAQYGQLSAAVSGGVQVAVLYNVITA